MTRNCIASVLKSSWLFAVGMVVLTFAHWASGIEKLLDFTATQAEMVHFNLNPPVFFGIGTILIQLGGSALMIFTQRWVWLGAAILGIFTVATIPIAHAFWNLEGQAAFAERMVVNEHITVLGGLILAAIAAELRLAPR